MDEATKEVLRECAADYYNALIASRKAEAALRQTLSTVKSNLCANKMYDTYHVHIGGNRYIIFEYDPDIHDGYHIREEIMNLVGDKNGR